MRKQRYIIRRKDGASAWKGPKANVAEYETSGLILFHQPKCLWPDPITCLAVEVPRWASTPISFKDSPVCRVPDTSYSNPIS